MARASPETSRSTSVRLAGKQLAGDDEALNLARPLADRGELDVAEVLLRGVILHEPVAAVDLHAILGGAHGNLARVQLGHRSEEHTSELQSQSNLVCRLLLEKKKKKKQSQHN